MKRKEIPSHNRPKISKEESDEIVDKAVARVHAAKDKQAQFFKELQNILLGD